MFSSQAQTTSSVNAATALKFDVSDRLNPTKIRGLYEDAAFDIAAMQKLLDHDNHEMRQELRSVVFRRATVITLIYSVLAAFTASVYRLGTAAAVHRRTPTINDDNHINEKKIKTLKLLKNGCDVTVLLLSTPVSSGLSSNLFLSLLLLPQEVPGPRVHETSIRHSSGRGARARTTEAQEHLRRRLHFSARFQRQSTQNLRRARACFNS